MEATYKTSGTDGTSPLDYQVRANGSAARVANPQTMRCSEVLLRSLAVVTTLVAVIVMGVSKEKKTVFLPLPPSLPPMAVEADAKWQYSSAFVFFMVANIVALAYALLSLIFTIASRGKSSGLGLIIVIVDLVMVALLFSSGGAAAAIGVLGYKGNSHTQWNKVCNVFDKFCGRVTGSIVISLLGSFIFMLLITLAVLSLYKIRSR